MKRNHMWWAAGLLAAGAVVTLLDALVLEKYFFELKTYDIGHKGGDKKLKLVFLTDLHFKQQLFPHYRKLATAINEINPDLILITGDTFDKTGKLEPAEEFLNLLDQQVQKVAIPGNNDYKSEVSLQELKALYQKHNCDLLVNESKAYIVKGARLMLTGLDDLLEGNSDFGAAVQQVGYEAHHLLLVHSPLQQEAAIQEMHHLNENREPDEQLNIRYIFAGHSHGGQVRLPGYVPILPAKSGDYVNGWYNEKAPYLYVSKGFGTSSIPFRFWARSEVTLFTYYI